MTIQDPRFEATVDAIRGDLPDGEAEARAAERAWSAVVGESASPAVPSRLASHDDFQALVPVYLRGELSAARKVLFEDHTRECLPCRKALRLAREGRSASPTVTTAVPGPGPGTGRWRWVAAAAAVAAIGFVSWMGIEGYLSPPMAEIARVRSIDGELLAVESEGMRPLRPGDPVAENESVRTTKGSTAVLRLGDGSLIEIGERSQLAVAERRRLVNVRVERGDIILQAAEQRQGELSVTTEDLLASVRGTIFAVGRGAKGSRVAVVEGEVSVAAGREERLLFAGEQFGSNHRIGALPFESAFEWSQDSDRYFELLREIRDLRRDLMSLDLAVDQRYESRFLNQVPADTIVYAGLPNPGASMAEVRSIVESRLDSSATLREWWNQSLDGSSGEAELILDLFETVSAELGEEVVFSLAGDPTAGAGPDGGALALAELVDPDGFQATLEAALADLGGEAGNLDVRFVVDPLDDGGTEADLLFWVDDDIVAGAASIETLRAYARTRRGGSGFVGTSFHRSLRNAYGEGVELLIGVDMETVASRIPEEADGESAEDRAQREAILEWSGIGAVRHLIADARTIDELSRTTARLSFNGRRRGVAAWLASPAPMGSLDFVSADASAASSFVFKDPLDIVDEIFALLETLAPDALDSLDAVQSRLGIDLRADLAASLGGEVAMAVDGPLLPEPSWKLVVEVYHPRLLQSTLETLVAALTEIEQEDGEVVRAGIASEEVSGRTFYALTVEAVDAEGRAHVTEVHYLYQDGYLVAAPSRALLERALKTRDSGYTFLESAEVRRLMPADRFINFSGLVYQDAASVLQPLVETASQMTSQLTPEQQELVAQVSEEALTPSLYAFYGERRAIRLVATSEGGVLGGAFSRLIGMGELASLTGVLETVRGAGVPGVGVQ